MFDPSTCTFLHEVFDLFEGLCLLACLVGKYAERQARPFTEQHLCIFPGGAPVV